MSEASESDDLDYSNNVSINSEQLDAIEELSTVSSAPSQICDFGRNCFVPPRNANILHQLFQRELGCPANKSPLFTPPLRTLYLTEVLPPAILRNQTFMGMTRCGRFLMTYSAHLLPGDEWNGCIYRYQLHWWTVTATETAREIASVVLFGSLKVSGPLQLYICQWPKFNDKVLVYGLQHDYGGTDADGAPINRLAYVTVTATPDTSCSECALVQQGLVLSMNTRCLKHSFAAHTSFEISMPYPAFQPKILLKFEDFAVFNTNNVIHAIRISLDAMHYEPRVETKFENLSVQVACSPTSAPMQSLLQEQIIRDFADDGVLTPRQNDCQSPSFSPIKQENFDCQWEVASPLNCMSPPLPTRFKTFVENTRIPNPLENNHQFLAPKGVIKVKKLGAKRGFRGFFSRRKGTLSVFREDKSRKTSPYEFVDDSQSEVEQLSQFRKKRLAEKTYEFQESDAENILPFNTEHPEKSPSKFYVLRPLNRNTPQCRLTEKRNDDDKVSPKRCRVRVSEDDVLVGDLSGRYAPLTIEEEDRLHAGLQRLRHCFRGSAARFIRCFFESDSPSVGNDLEEDESSVSLYHTLLNMEVYGSEDTPLPAVSSPPSDSSAKVQVEQQSLDIEVICHSVATSLCVVAQKTFIFCSDYDVEVIDVCPRSGDVLILLMMRIGACEGKKMPRSITEHYETSVTLLWNLVRGDYRVIMVVPPQKMPWNEKCVWNPAREASRAIRMSLPADVTDLEPAVRCCSNSSVLRGASLACIRDYDNGIQFRL